MALLEEPTLVEAIMDAREQIDFLWQFFVSVHIALFALVFIYGSAVERLNWPARILSIFGIAGFEWINGNALSNAYLLLDSMLEQYRWSFGQVERFHPAFYEQFVLASYADRPGMVLITHSAALLVIILAFLSQRFFQGRLSAQQMARGHDPRES
ncbi:MAG: hypothetical protein CTY31_13250 [Hyphomicrobium sp.]|nr:MAG: hypothetical protein CTY31_13250 [Hyphomicrobium sp.]